MTAFWIFESPAAGLLAIAGLISALGGIFSTILANRRTRSEGYVECEEKLRAIRTEAGDLSTQLYELRRSTGTGAA